MKAGKSDQCPHCGEQLASKDRKFNPDLLSWLFLVPLVLIIFLPLPITSYFDPDPLEDLEVASIRRQINGQSMDVFGVVRNKSKRQWAGVTVEVELFSEDGSFLEEYSETLETTIRPDSDEHFKFTARIYHPAHTRNGVELRAKIAKARKPHLRF